MKKYNIFLCEDDKYQRVGIENAISQIIMKENFHMKIKMSTDNPHEVLEYVQANKDINVYFFDVNLGSNMSGIELAKKIRQHDPKGYIVFITEKSELAYLTFKYKIHAIDYIEKDYINGIKDNIYDCLKTINDNIINSLPEDDDVFIVKIGDRCSHIKYREILFFETSEIPHKIKIHTTTGYTEFYGKLKDIESTLDNRFYKCHRAYIVNKNNIKEIDFKNKQIEMITGDICLASSRLIRGLK